MEDRKKKIIILTSIIVVILIIAILLVIKLTTLKNSDKTIPVNSNQKINNTIQFGNPESIEKLIDDLTYEMNKAAREMDFERAIELRDAIFELQSSE